jgi:hypothetical protein
MKPKRYVVLGVCLTVASLFLCSASNYPMSVSIAEPMDSHSVNGALVHALVYIEQKYDLPGLTQLAWNASVDNHPDLSYATHHVFTNKPETVSELQAAYAIDPTHSGFWTGQLTVIVHAPDDQHFSHQVTLIDAEEHIVWSGKVDVDGHITEFMHYE